MLRPPRLPPHPITFSLRTLHPNLHPPRLRTLLPQRRAFRPSTRLNTDPPPFPNHYATLHLPPTASAKEIKSSFYALSKQHHPDKNPDNPSASKRFVAVSEAYHVLGSPDQRARYDRDFHRVHGSSAAHSRAHRTTGSHSSHTAHAHGHGPAGGRPASGLSRRRTQFRGPPPSFYTSGGYGAHGAKRTGADSSSSSSSSSHPSSSGSGGTAGEGAFAGGYGPGQAESTYGAPDPDLPHWDRAGHFRTHQNLQGGIKMRRGVGVSVGLEREGIPLDGVGETTTFNFFVVSGLLIVAVGVPTWYLSRDGRKGEKEKEAAAASGKRKDGG